MKKGSLNTAHSNGDHETDYNNMKARNANCHLGVNPRSSFKQHDTDLRYSRLNPQTNEPEPIFVEFDSEEAFLQDYLYLNPCPFELEEGLPATSFVYNSTPNHTRTKIKCSQTEHYFEPVLSTICEKCQSAHVCVHKESFQTGYRLRVKLANPSKKQMYQYSSKYITKTSLQPLEKVKDVRLKNHPASLWIDRSGFVLIRQAKGTPRKRLPVDRIPGVRLLPGGQLTSRLMAAVSTHLIQRLDHDFIAEGYGIASRTVDAISSIASSTVRKAKLENLCQQIENGTLGTAYDTSGRPFLQMEPFFVDGEECIAVLKCTPINCSSQIPEELWKQKTELVYFYSVKEAEELRDRWERAYRERTGAFLYAPLSFAYMCPTSIFTTEDRLIIFLFEPIRKGTNTPAEIIYLICQLWMEIIKEFESSDLALSKNEETFDIFNLFPSSPLDLTTMRRTKKTLAVFATVLHNEWDSPDNIRINSLIRSLNTAVDRLCKPVKKNASNLYRAFLEEREMYIHYISNLTDRIKNVLKKGLETGDASDAISKMLYFNEAVIPTIMTQESPKPTFPFNADGDIDTKYIKSIGIPVHCLEYLLDQGLMDNNRVEIISCVSEKLKLGKAHPCSDCNICPLITALAFEDTFEE